MECLKEIIGITNTDCPCILDGLTENEVTELKKSTSGLYLDQVEGGINMRAIVAVDSCKNFAKMALQARDEAIKTIEADLLVAISQKYSVGKAAYVGHIGRPSYTSTLSVSKRYQFLKISPSEKSDSVMQLTGLRIILDSAINTTVKLIAVEIDGNQGTEILTADIMTIANTYTAVPLGGNPISLPLTVNGKRMDYYVIYDLGATGAKPKDIKLSCNCPGGNGFEQFVVPVGGEMDDMNMLNQNIKNTTYSQGISLDVDLRCVPGMLVCREFDRENAIAVTMAWCVRYKAQEILIESILGSNEVNRYTMMNREALYGKRNHFRKEYNDRIPYLASVIDVASSDCYVCRDNQMFFQGILA